MIEQSLALKNRTLLAVLTLLMCFAGAPSISAHGPDGVQVRKCLTSKTVAPANTYRAQTGMRIPVQFRPTIVVS